MNIKRTKAIARKEFIHILRDSKSLFASIFIPVMLLVLFGWALNLDVDRIETVICDFDNSPKSRELVSRISKSRFFNVVDYPASMKEAEEHIMYGRAAIMMCVPAGFEKRLANGESPAIGVDIDGSDANRATIGLGYLSNMISIFSNELLNEKMTAAGMKKIEPPLEMRQIVWFNPELESKNYIVPGLIAVIMTVISAMITSLTIAREWERGTMEQLISTPVRGRELIIGKLIPYVTIGYIDVFISVIMGILLFKVPFHGSYLTLFIMGSIFLVGAMSFGILISIAGKSQLIANQLSLLTAFLPAFLLSGFAFTIENMPIILQIMSQFFPATYFVKILKNIFLKGVGFEILFYDMAMLSIYCLVLFVLANKKFKKRLE
ncbi:MAG TPA: ABC transporter permease [Candidatus Wallbacteria bacterium]|nr:ABC transporter permease [Candidatus Wallbacteria bacterium]